MSIIPTVILYLFFFFQSSGHHRDLHSFPTRRSSDLYLWEPGFIAREKQPIFFHDPDANDERVIDVGMDGPDFARHRRQHEVDRKSTRLNSSHQIISYAVFCLKKKKKNKYNTILAHNC